MTRPSSELTTSASVVLVVSLIATTGLAQEAARKGADGWKTVTSKKGGFSVAFPPGSKPEEQSYGAISATIRMEIFERTHLFYYASWEDIAEDSKEKTADQLLDQKRDEAVRSLKSGRLGREEKIRLGDYPGREIEVVADKWDTGAIVTAGRFIDRSRVYIVGTRIYHVTVFGDAKSVSAKDTEAFLDSFKLAR